MEDVEVIGVGRSKIRDERVGNKPTYTLCNELDSSRLLPLSQWIAHDDSERTAYNTFNVFA